MVLNEINANRTWKYVIVTNEMMFWEQTERVECYTRSYINPVTFY